MSELGREQPLNATFSHLNPIRQAAILTREVVRFRSELGLNDWPCVIAGGDST
jgi:hypothetical protein